MFHSPEQFTKIGVAHRRYGDIDFGIKLKDRLLHQFVLGQTGTGKSTLMANMAFQDAQAGLGFCLVDPHGDLAEDIIRGLGQKHLYWNVADPFSPYGYNPLTSVSAMFRPLVASGLIDTLKKQWSDSWGARMEHLLRYAILALLEQPQTDLRDIMRLFFDKDFKREVTSRLVDPQVRQFWALEFPAMGFKNAADGVAPIANKLGAFLAHPVVRKAVCEPVEPLRFRRIMDNGQFLIINLSKGKLGADTANVLGGLIVSSIMHAALSRHNVPQQQRRPFMLYVDEFHSFSTTALAGMLSEIRKYAVGVFLASQYTAQIERPLVEAIWGNVGTIISFRIGALDAPFLTQQFADVSARTLITLPNHRIMLQLMVDGMKSKAFSATTHPPLTPRFI